MLQSRMSNDLGESLYETPEVLIDPWCDPCNDEDVYRPAAEYCPTCVEFYCTTCSKSHRQHAVTRYHTTQRNNEMPSSHAAKPLRFQECLSHTGLVKDRFCLSHKTTVCAQCTKMKHDSCDTKSVIDACNAFDKADLTELENILQEAKDSILSLKSDIEDNIGDFEAERLTASNKAILTSEDALSKLNAVYDIASKQINNIYRLTDQLSPLKNFLLSPVEANSSLQKSPTVCVQSFLYVQKIAKTMQDGTAKLNEINEKLKKTGLVFTPDPVMLQLMSSLSVHEKMDEIFRENIPLMSGPEERLPFAKISMACTVFSILADIKLSEKGSFFVKIFDDKKDCYITGIDITPDGRLVLADCNNKKIKIFSSRVPYESSLTLWYEPSDTAVISNKEIIVSLWKNFCCMEQLYVLDIDSTQPSIKQTIRLRFPVRSVKVHRNKLIVSCQDHPPSVKLLDRTGRIYWSRNLDNSGKQLFLNPSYMTHYLETDRLRVIVTDFDKQTITKLNGDTGELIKVCHSPGKRPVGVSADASGNTYVSCKANDEIYIWSADLTVHKRLLTKKTGLCHPNYIKYCELESQLLVASGSDIDRQNSITLFGRS